jgi:hypothetical protein
MLCFGSFQLRIAHKLIQTSIDQQSMMLMARRMNYWMYFQLKM